MTVYRSRPRGENNGGERGNNVEAGTIRRKKTRDFRKKEECRRSQKKMMAAPFRGLRNIEKAHRNAHPGEEIHLWDGRERRADMS